MDANRLPRSKNLRLVVFLAYALLLLVYMPRNAVTVPC
jgi:hypothetical protein